jgi:hypothetical protein
MSLFSAVFGRSSVPKHPSAAARLAEVCVKVRQEYHFLEYYTSNCEESSAVIMRLNFSKDVLLILMSSVVLMRHQRDNHQRLMQFNEEVRTRYLSMIPVSPTSLVGDCLVCEDEIAAIAPFVAPNAPLSQLRTTIVSTTGLISLVVDYRASEFRNDVIDGMVASKGSPALWEPAARTFLGRIRGVGRDTISPDDVSYMTVALSQPFGALLDAEVDLE